MTLERSKVRFTSAHQGETYYFCSSGCKKTFDADPATYAKTAAAVGAAHAGHGGHGAGGNTTAGAAQTEIFGRDVDGLADAAQPTAAEVVDGATLDFVAMPVRKRINDTDVKMLAYNGSIPGPELRVKQDSEVSVQFRNEMDLETTVHWHGLRHDNFFDGVPSGPHAGVQAPIPPGGAFTYKLRFPDPGIYWYHPHVREDYAQEHGLYGSIVVTQAIRRIGRRQTARSA
jgi:FtsP/CotA-like multicopper oxidase with cupredoxin domain